MVNEADDIVLRLLRRIKTGFSRLDVLTTRVGDLDSLSRNSTSGRPSCLWVKSINRHGWTGPTAGSTGSRSVWNWWRSDGS